MLHIMSYSKKSYLYKTIILFRIIHIFKKANLKNDTYWRSLNLSFELFFLSL